HTHPLAVVGQQVCRNFYYEGPLILNRNGDSGDGHPHETHGGNGDDMRKAHGNGECSARADWMISQLKSARAAERQRAEWIQRRAEEAERQRSEEAWRRLAAIVESSSDGIVSTDLQGIITSWNHGAERLFGYSTAEATGKPEAMLLSVERVDAEPSLIERISRGECIDHYETVRRCKDGTLVDISLTVSP